MSKERMKDLLIIAMLPFLVVAYQSIDWSFLNPNNFPERKCDIYHENAPIGLKCEMWQTEE